MTQEQAQALQKVIDYLEKDESRNWEENDRPSNHIYMDILQLRSMLMSHYEDLESNR